MLSHFQTSLNLFNYVTGDLLLHSYLGYMLC